MSFRPITYGEHAYGFPRVGQSILNCPDGTIVKLFIDGEPFLPAEAEVLSYRRVVDLAAGTLVREIAVVDARRPAHAAADASRLVSFDQRHLAAFQYELVPEDADTEIVISSEMLHREPLPGDGSDPRLAVGFASRVLQPAGTRREGLRAILSYTTRQFRPGSGLRHGPSSSKTDCPVSAEGSCEDDFAAIVFKTAGRARQADPPLEVSGLPLRRGRRCSRDPLAGGLDARPRDRRAGSTLSWTAATARSATSGNAPMSRWKAPSRGCSR